MLSFADSPLLSHIVVKLPFVHPMNKRQVLKPGYCRRNVRIVVESGSTNICTINRTLVQEL